MRYSMKTDKGIIRNSNQDNCHVVIFDNSSCFGVVCDGMGGPKAGDIASELAIKEISDKFTAGWSPENTIDDARVLLTKAIKTANLKILAMSSSDEAYSGMGTTVVAAFCKDNDVLIANVGDSRAYSACEDNIRQITRDHSLVQELIDKGELSREDAESYPDKNVITRALGIDNHVEIDFYIEKLDSSCLLLCSDGLYNYCKENEIISILNDEETEFSSVASALVDAANNNGGGDNVTAVLIKR